MKKLLLGMLLFGFAGLMSCGLLDELIPDVDTSYSSEFVVNIVSNQGETLVDSVDINEFQEYQDFKENINGFKITRITYSVVNPNVPDNMYFRGTVKCYSSDGQEVVSVGTIDPVKLNDFLNISNEQDVVQNEDGVNTLIGWLEGPGTFKMNAVYSLTDAAGGAYSISGTEHGFTLKLKFYVTVLTGA